MIVYKTQWKNTGLAVLKAWAITFVPVSLLVIFGILSPNAFIKDNYYYIVGVVLIIHFLRDIFADRIQEIQVDDENHQITVLHKTLRTRLKTTVLAFETLKLEAERSSFHWLLGKGPLVIYLLKNKMEVFSIHKVKDGFSTETLTRFQEQLKELLERTPPNQP